MRKVILIAVIVLVQSACVATRPSELLRLVEIEINQSPTPVDDYITWSPTLCRIRAAAGSSFPPLPVRLSNFDTTTGGQIAFANAPIAAGTTATASTVSLTLPADGSWVPFVIAGQFGFPSTRDKDAVIEVREDRPDGVVLGRAALMVRVRKNANALTDEERGRFLGALATLNSSPFNNYVLHQMIHSIASSQAHGGPAFLPWHRAALLRIERELQAVDPSVTLPYWKFDDPAVNVFHPDFMGISDQTGANMHLARFNIGNPLTTWTIEGFSGIQRLPSYLPTSGAPVSSELTTLALGSGMYSGFRGMEFNPHNPSHTSTGGGYWLSSVPTAVRDPLFFMLHCNVDRLWAKWQWINDRFDPLQASSYDPQGAYPGLGSFGPGQYALNKMWPWNGLTGSPYPATAPGGGLPLSIIVGISPPSQPTPGDMIAYRGSATLPRGMGFAYDDVGY